MRQPTDNDLRTILEPYRAGRLEQAAGAARKFTRRWRDHETGWLVLGKSLYQLGELEDAVAALRTASRINPGAASIHNDLGLALLALRRPGEAEAALGRGLELRPDDPGMLANLGIAQMGQDRYREAERTLRRALVAQPEHPEALDALAHDLRRQGRLREAVRLFRKRASLRPGDPRAHSDLGNALRELEDHDAAERALRRAVELEPGDAGTHCDLGIVLAERGAFDDATAAFSAALERKPDLVEAHAGLIRAKTLAPDDPAIGAIRELLARPDLGDGQRSRLHYALGHALVRLGAEPAQAWAELAAGARHRRRILDYDAASERALFDRIRTTFTADRLAAVTAPEPPQPSGPVFIVGMPRSGTTLVEQILGAHPAIATAGERSDLDRLIGAAAERLGTAYPEGFGELAADALGEIARGYREAVTDTFADAERVIDKQPENYRHLGLIAAAMPGAVIVHVRREPADTCVSCFMQDFVRPLAYTNDLAELGHHYRRYAGLMDHWHAVLPAGRMIEVRYEDLIADLETEAGRLLSFLGLPWDPACARFHEDARPVRTASLAQVRRPLYSSSIGQWRRYAEHLGPLFEALGPLAPAEGPGAPHD